MTAKVRAIRLTDCGPSTNRQTKRVQLLGVSNILWSIAFHVHIPRIVFRRYFSSSGLPISSRVFNDDSISGHPSAEPL